MGQRGVECGSEGVECGSESDKRREGGKGVLGWHVLVMVEGKNSEPGCERIDLLLDVTLQLLQRDLSQPCKQG